MVAGRGAWKAGPLPGPRQSVFRAELYALVQALELHDGPLEVVLDCLPVQQRMERVLQGGQLPRGGYHEDLWRRAARAAAGRLVTVRWVPAHCKEEDVSAGRISREDWERNAQADEKAKEAQRLWGPHGQREAAAARTDRLVLGVLSMGARVYEALQADVKERTGFLEARGGPGGGRAEGGGPQGACPPPGGRPRGGPPGGFCARGRSQEVDLQHLWPQGHHPWFFPDPQAHAMRAGAGHA